MGSSRLPLFVSHDGAIDEFLAVALCAISPGVDLLGVSLIHGDCLAEPALAAQIALLRCVGRGEVRSSLSAARGWNSFPWAYRSDCLDFAALPLIAANAEQAAGDPALDGEKRLTEALASAAEPVTILVLGPLTQVRLALEPHPSLHSKVSSILWAGGALDVPGNIDPHTVPGLPANPRAEWNVYWDPFALDWLLRETTLPLTLLPLDLTDQAPVSQELRELLGEGAAKGSRLPQLALDAYDLVQDQPFYQLWDVTAAAFAIRPSLFAPPTRLRLETQLWGPTQGAVRRSSEGREVEVVFGFSRGVRALYRWYAESLAAAG